MNRPYIHFYSRHLRHALGSRGKSLLKAPVGDLAARSEPDSLVRFHVADDVRQRLGAAGPARNVRMKLERAESRREARFLVKLIEHRLPDDQGVVGISRVPVAVGA